MVTMFFCSPARRRASLFCFFTVWITGGPTLAQWPQPAGLTLGDKYHLVFNSSTSITGTSPEISAYNALAQAAADAADIGGAVTWSALASTASTHARDNAVIGPSTPVYNMNLEQVATGFDDMWDGTLTSTLHWDEQGQRNRGDAWTGTLPDGTGAPGLTLGHESLSAWCGRPTVTNEAWMNFITPPTSISLHVYALSQELTVVLFGDANNDGLVTGADIIAVQQNFAEIEPGFPTGTYVGDANDDGLVTGADIIAIQTNFGAVFDNAPTPTAPIPEPATLLSLTLLLAAFARSVQRATNHSICDVK